MAPALPVSPAAPIQSTPRCSSPGPSGPISPHPYLEWLDECPLVFLPSWRSSLCMDSDMLNSLSSSKAILHYTDVTALV